MVAGATLTFAGIAFSVSLLLISLASSQYSPRVVHGLFRDPFNKRIMGVVVGTFTYCLVILRSVRGPLEEAGPRIVPNISVLLAVVLGIISVLSIVAFISHSAHTMEVSVILGGVTDEAVLAVRGSWTNEAPDAAGPEVPAPRGAGFVVAVEAQGWIQQIDHDALLGVLPPEACMQLETDSGRYAIPGTRCAPSGRVPGTRRGYDGWSATLSWSEPPARCSRI